MASNNTQSVTVGGGSLGAFLLTGLFVYLKVTGQVDWAWIWVFAPLWIGFAIFLAIIILIFLGVLIAGLIDEFKIKKSSDALKAARATKFAHRNSKLDKPNDLR